jgi:hypothetical protein
VKDDFDPSHRARHGSWVDDAAFDELPGARKVLQVFATPLEKSSRMTTLSPLESSASAMDEPMKPAPPVIK